MGLVIWQNLAKIKGSLIEIADSFFVISNVLSYIWHILAAAKDVFSLDTTLNYDC